MGVVMSLTILAVILYLLQSYLLNVYYIPLTLIVSVAFLCDCYYLNFWNRRGVKQYKTVFLLGCLKDVVLLRKESIATLLKKIYDETKHDMFYGIYLFYKPALLINDSKLVKEILIKEFHTFHDRATVNSAEDAFAKNLYFLKGEKWKNFRAKMSEAFTLHKIKGMLSTLMENSENLQKHIGAKVETNECTLDIQEICDYITTVLLANLAFGLQTDSTENEFKEICRKLKCNIFKSKEIPKKFYQKPTDNLIDPIMTKNLRETVENRENCDIQRNDFLDSLILLKNHGRIEKSEHDGLKIVTDLLFMHKCEIGESEKLSFEELCAQAIMFFTAGFEGGTI